MMSDEEQKKFVALYQHICAGKNLYSCVTRSFPLPTGGEVEHEVIRLMRPYADTARAQLLSEAILLLPDEYDTVVWRVKPEITYYTNHGIYSREVDPATCIPDIIALYMRLSFVLRGHQVYSKVYAKIPS